MDKLNAELSRLYLPPLAPPPDAPGGSRAPVDLATADGLTRAIVIPFRRRAGEGDEAAHWQRLCEVANVLQSEFDFPAPAVSVASTGGYLLWLSLAAPVAVADAERFLLRLGQARFPDMAPAPAAAAGPVELPPSLNRDNGRWSAFIHPGMGASFADESGLDMPPPAAGQLAFLEGLRSIDPARFRAALDKLGPVPVPVPASDIAPAATSAAAPAPVPSAAPDGLLLKDATLDDVVRWLHARNIEPTFRFLLPN